MDFCLHHCLFSTTRGMRVTRYSKTCRLRLSSGEKTSLTITITATVGLSNMPSPSFWLHHDSNSEIRLAGCLDTRDSSSFSILLIWSCREWWVGRLARECSGIITVQYRPRLPVASPYLGPSFPTLLTYLFPVEGPTDSPCAHFCRTPVRWQGEHRKTANG